MQKEQLQAQQLMIEQSKKLEKYESEAKNQTQGVCLCVRVFVRALLLCLTLRACVCLRAEMEKRLREMKQDTEASHQREKELQEQLEKLKKEREELIKKKKGTCVIL